MISPSVLQFDKVWGYELWIASTHKDGLQPDFEKAAGGDYPLLVKIIQANDTLSVQVHPDDDDAKKLEGPDVRGKTECWYVLDAAPGAKLVYGLNNSYTTDQLRTAIEEKKLESCLNTVEVHKGDFIFIPSGTVHAIGGGLRLLEVQQSCNTTYRLYDWGRPRELHVEKGLQVIKNRKMDDIRQFPGEFACPYFTLEQIHVSGGYGCFVPKSKIEGDITAEKARIIPSMTQLLFIISGSGTIRATYADGTKAEPQQFSKEKLFAVLPGEKIVIEGSAEVMKICAK